MGCGPHSLGCTCRSCRSCQRRPQNNWLLLLCPFSGLVFSHANYYLHRGQPSFLISKCVTHSHMGCLPRRSARAMWSWCGAWMVVATNNSQIWERSICLVSNMAFCNLRSCIWRLENSSRPEVVLRVSRVLNYYGDIPAQHRHLLHQQSAGPGSICYGPELQGPGGNRSQLALHCILGHINGGYG